MYMSSPLTHSCTHTQLHTHTQGLLLGAIRDPNPVIFFEPKGQYRASVGEVPVGDYELPLGVGEIVSAGSDITVVAWGAQVSMRGVVLHVNVCVDEGFVYHVCAWLLSCALHSLTHTHTHTHTHTQVRVVEQACEMVTQQTGASCEIIDLRSVLPWDREIVIDSVMKVSV
jgi:2-oxoisovalerate dehydrogenase E1 component beta subunit